MKRREARERDEAVAREQAERRTEALLARLRDQEAAARQQIDEEAAATENGREVPRAPQVDVEPS